MINLTRHPVPGRAGKLTKTLTALGQNAFDRDVFLATTLINLLSLSLPLAMMQIFNRVIPNGSSGTLLGIYLILIGYVVSDTLLKIARMRLYLTASAREESATARAVFDGLFRAHLPDLRGIGRDSLAERLGQLRDIGKLNSGLLLASRVDLVFTAFFVAVIFALAPVLAMVALLCILTVAVWSIRVRAKFRAASQMRNVNDTRRGSFLIEVFRLAPEVKLLGIEQVLLRRYEMLQHSSSDASETLISITASAATVAAIVGQVATGLVSVVGAYLVIGAKIGLAELAATILLTGRTIQPVIQALFVDMDLEILRRADQQVKEIARMPGRGRNDAPVKGSATPIPLPVRFDRVTLREPNTRVKLLDRVDLTLPPGSLTVIHGRSDAPAELLLHLIAGEIVPQSGRITVGAGVLALSDQVVSVGYDQDLHDGAVLKNLTAFRGRSFEADPLRIGRMLGLEQDIRVLPGGYAHRLTQDARGHGSQGLYRKIHIVRALSIPSGVYLLDRPFDGLDPNGQRLLLDYLQDLRARATLVLSSPPPGLAIEPDLSLSLRPDLALQIERKRRGPPAPTALDYLPRKDSA